MEYNQSVWAYYPANNQPYTDPLYAPYTRKLVPITGADGETQLCPVNTYKPQGSCGMTHPELVRKGWGMGFQRMHPDKDPCPPGFTPGVDGWCTAEKPEFEGTFYTDKAFVAKYQYWDGYAPKNQCAVDKDPSPFHLKSVHPQTGRYVVYHQPKQASTKTVYGKLATRDSLLA